MSSKVSPRDSVALKRLLGAMVVLFGAAMVEKAVGLSAPMPTLQSPARLVVKGYRVAPLSEAPPRRGREMSHGVLRRFRLLPLAESPALTLTLVPVSSRTGTDLSAETMGGKGLSMDTVGTQVPGFSLKDSRLVSWPVAEAPGSAPRVDQLLLGRGPLDAAGRSTRLQTCLTPTGMAAVKATTLAGENQPPAKPGPPAAQRRLWRLAGLSPVRHACLAVQLERATGGDGGGEGGGHARGDSQTQLRAAWTALRKVLVEHQGTEASRS